MPTHTRTQSRARRSAGFALLLALAVGGAGESLLSASPAEAWRRRPADRAEVFLLGTLYKRHETVPAYDLPALRRIILAIKPDALVIDCTPRETAEQRVHPSKIEYPGVVFPLMREGHYKVYPAEPDEPLFSEIVQSLIAANAALEKERPAAAAASKGYAESTYAALTAIWRSPADVHGDATAALFAAKQALDAALVGPVMSKGGERWNRHWADAILKAVSENPGRRILALAGIENRAAIAKLVESDPRVTLVDTFQWLQEHP